MLTQNVGLLARKPQHRVLVQGNFGRVLGGAQPGTRALWEWAGLFHRKELVESEGLRETAFIRKSGLITWGNMARVSGFIIGTQGQGHAYHRGKGTVSVGWPQSSCPCHNGGILSTCIY